MFIKGWREGQGTMTFKNGDKLTAHWTHDVMQEDKVCMIYSDGNQYEGEWRISKRWGSGKMTYTNKDIYEGQWKSDRREGYGIYEYADGAKKGDIYKGEWSDDKKEGQGIYTHVDGTTIEGKFYDNEPDEICTVKRSDGTTKKVGF